MLTRVSVKVSLAWSTAAQMGFMLVECGLGAYGLALLHLVAHSLYKAHAFLSSGQAVEQQVVRRMTPALPRASLARWLAGGVGGLATAAAAGALASISPTREPGLAALGVVFGLALAPLYVRASQARQWRPAAAAVGLALGLTAVYAGWHLLFGALVPTVAGATAGGLFRAGLVALGFGGLFVVQAAISAAPEGRLARALYPACFAGFYLDEIFTRYTFKLWPPRPAPAPAALARQRATLSLERAA
jgi:NAD(P)H-quinone oxidoreductase subunit 5